MLGFDFSALPGLNKMREAPPPPEEARLAAFFMKRLKGDSVGPGEPATLEQVIGRVAQSVEVQGRPDAPFEKKLEQIADKLIGSLDALVRDEYVKNADGSFVTDAQGNKQVNSVKLDSGVAARLREVIVSSGAKSPAELANTLKNFDNNPDPNQKESLFYFLHRGGKDFAVTYSGDEVAMVRQFLNMITPGLGDTVVGILGFNKHAEASPNSAKHRLEDGFKAMTGGNASLEKFWKPEQPDGMPFLSLNPRHTVQPGEWGNYFSDSPTGNLGYAYDFYGEAKDGKHALANRGFKETVLNRWEKEGTVRFDNDVARTEFTSFVRQTVAGGMMGGEFTQALQKQGKEGLIDFQTPEAQAAFENFTRTLDARSLTKDQVADKIIEFVEREPGMAFKPLDPKFDDQVYRNSTKMAIASVAQHYIPAKSASEFAKRIEAFAASRPDIKLAGEDAQAKAPAATAGVMQAAPMQQASPPASSAPSPEPAGVLRAGATEPDANAPKAIGVYRRVEAEGVSYGGGAASVTAANLSELGLRGEFPVYSMDAQGNLTELGMMTPEKLLNTSFGELGVQLVMQDGVPVGYFAHDPGRGTGIYLSQDAIDRDAMKDDLKQKLRPDYQENQPHAPQPTSPTIAPGLGR